VYQSPFKSLAIIAGVVVPCTILLIGCSDAATSPGPPKPPRPGIIATLILDTFEGSGQSVHPDPVVVPAGWGTSQSYLVATPYPNGNQTYENPSFYEETSSLTWRAPGGAVNPVIRPDAGYLSDPDQLYNPVTHEIWMYYRQVTTTNQILLLRTADGVHWSAPQLLVTVPNHLAISPTVVRKSATDWWMWTVNGGTKGCSGASTTVEARRSVDGVTWSDPTTVTMQDGSKFPWHLDVTWVPQRNEYWALYNAKDAGSCTTTELRFATSTDGIQWTVLPTPLLARGAIPEFADVVYRSSLSYDAASDQVTIWYSGARVAAGKYIWGLATQSMARATMFAIASGTEDGTAPTTVQMNRQTPAGQGPPTAPATPPLTNETAP